MELYIQNRNSKPATIMPKKVLSIPTKRLELIIWVSDWLFFEGIVLRITQFYINAIALQKNSFVIATIILLKSTKPDYSCLIICIIISLDYVPIYEKIMKSKPVFKIPSNFGMTLVYSMANK